MNRKLGLLAFISFFVIIALISRTTSSQSLASKQCLIPQSGTIVKSRINMNRTLAETVHNLDTGLNYTTIQAAINALETLDGHTILVDADIYYEHVIVNKSISLIGLDRSTTIIDGNETGTVVTIMKNNVNVTGFTIQNSGGLDFGIVLNNVDCCNITGNNVANNRRGIRLEYSSSNNISGNSVTANNYDGISLYSSSRNTVCGNNVTSNGFGIHLYSSSRNTVCGNNITSNSVGIFLECSANNNIFSGNNITNNDCGIRLHVLLSNNIIFGNNVTNNGVGICFWHSSDNIISGNNITANNDCGILLDSSSSNTVCGNNVTSNGFGICFWYSSSNTVYHNNFVINTRQVNNYDSTNIWDNGYPWGGNYWSNYTDIDSDHDGIGDTPHVIDANNTDNYPLMGIFHSFNTSLGHYVNVISNSTIEGFDYFVSNSTIRMYVSNMTIGQAYGFCQVCIPNTLMDVSNISVIIDNGAAATLYPNYNVYDNGTHRWIYFAYEHSTHEIDIIPEFSSLLVLSLFMMATLLAVIVYKRKHAE